MPKEEKGLSAKIKRFTEEYIIDYNGTKAAIRAGYAENSAAVQASRLLKNDKVLSRIRELQNEQKKRLCINADWVLLQFVEVFRRCMQMEPIKEWDYNQHKFVESGKYSFDAKNANKALEKIGERIGFFEGDNGSSNEKAAAFEALLRAFGGEVNPLPNHAEGEQ